MKWKMSTYFNFPYLSFCISGLISLTFLVWIQSHCGRDVGFEVFASVMVLGLVNITTGTPFYRNRLPQRSVLTHFAQVLVAWLLVQWVACLVGFSMVL